MNHVPHWHEDSEASRPTSIPFRAPTAQVNWHICRPWPFSPSLSSEPAMSLEFHPHTPSPQSDEEEKASPSSTSSSASSPAAEDARPFLRPSASAAGGGGRSRRRRTVSEPSLRSLSSHTSRGRSFGRDVGHAAAETFLLTRLAITLLRYLGWITKFLALIFYATLLTPGFLQGKLGDLGLASDRLLYENYLNLSPLLLEILCSYKAWGALLGRRLAERGIVVACIDYRYVVQTLPY
ncbi:hypothetical protein BHE74_00032717 [Ensete ventricosum]|nr:hypothetical protein BHE74_00032717 [Ensete ventricosum]